MNWLKRTWKKLTAAVLAALAAVAAFFGFDAVSGGATVTDNLTWAMPTQYVDGTAIPPGTLTGTRIVWGTAPGGPYANEQDIALPATSAQLTRPGDGYGTRCYRVAALIGTANGLWSGEGCKNVQAPPREPTNFQVQ